MSNYQTLVRILDQIRKEASPEYRSYYPIANDTEKLNEARSLAFIHLFLKVKCGLLDFNERIKYVTDGIDDGGIDGYYIDEANRKIFFIQSKFRANEANFEAKEILLQELLKIEADRIIDGNTCYENGKKYNGRIQNMINQIQSIRDIARWDYHVVILANLEKVTDVQLKKLVGGLPIETFNFERCYNDLVFPVVSGCYYAASDVYVYLNLTQKNLGERRIRYRVETQFRDCEITVVFVPTIEVAKVMHRYKNSILKYNPRSYLDLSRNPVNSQIAKTIRERTTNEFALFNNGITILSDETSLQEQTGIKNIAQLKVTNPQIINGGQTAYTLCKIYEDGLNGGNPETPFEDKEVLLKIITFIESDSADNEAKKLQLIESVSKATNQQTAVTEADRKSNDKAQVEIQTKIFREFGYFYERKRGEFWNGLQDKYIDASSIIDRETFLRICVACNGLAAEAKGSSETDLFKEEKLYSMLCDSQKSKLYFFGYLCYDRLNRIHQILYKDRFNRHGTVQYGNALRYGKFAVISAVTGKLTSDFTGKELSDRVNQIIDEYLGKWLAFERHISKLEKNKDYFVPMTDSETGSLRYEMNYANYYKGRTLNSDLKAYFNV